MTSARSTPSGTAIVPIGEWIEGYGEVQMVGFTGGERYYWLLGTQNVVSMMPACVIEPLYEEFK